MYITDFTAATEYMSHGFASIASSHLGNLGFEVPFKDP